MQADPQPGPQDDSRPSGGGAADSGWQAAVAEERPVTKVRRRIAHARQAQAPVPVIIIDPSPLVRTGLARILANTRFRVKEELASLSDLSDNIVNSKTCIVFFNLGNDPNSSLDVIAELIAKNARLHAVVLADRLCEDDLLKAIEAEASGYLLKDEPIPVTLGQALELMLFGMLVIPQAAVQTKLAEMAPIAPPVADVGSGLPLALKLSDAGDRPANRTVRLSTREQTILDKLTEGASNKQIARELKIAEATVKVHIKSLLRKIGAQNRTQAAMWALEQRRARDEK
jgi:two-component system nitrate/nitrite response regulator NarL